MAGCSFWCKENDGKINYTKLCRLLVDGGTQAVRAVFDKQIPPSSSLTAFLNANKTTLQKLKKPKGKVLNDEQWDKLYPASGSNPKSEDFDITLLFVLLRNICGLTPPVCEITSAGKRKRSWDRLPHKTDNSLEANLVKVKYYRNNTIAHKPNTETNDADFEQYWQDISSALVSLGLSQEAIDDLKSARLGEKDYDQLLYDWYESDKDIKTYVEDVKSDTADIKSDTADIKSDTADIKLDTADIKSDTALIPDMKDDINDLRNSFKNTQTQNQQIANLAKDEFKGLIESLCASFHPNTRRWLLDQVELHVHNSQSSSRVMLITAGPGMGKSILAAKICETYKKVGHLGGCHFFQFSNSRRNNPRLMLQSIASQLCDSIPGFEEVLEKKLQTPLGRDLMDLNCEELFTVLLEEPLHNLKRDLSNGDNREFVVVLDAIDECCSDLKNEVEEIFRDKFPLLPSWLRFVITTRPSPRLHMHDSMYRVFIDPKCVQNKLDLENFYKAKFEPFRDFKDHSLIISQLVEMTEGLFLVAFFIVDYMQKEKLTSLTNLLGLFPNGISSVYEKYFQRAKTVLLPFISEEERFFKMLEAVVAAKDPIPISMMYSILDLKKERDVSRQERKTRKDALTLLHSLFPSENDHVTAFHKTVVDWLMLDGDEEHEFSVRVDDGNEVLACQCYNALDDIQNGKKALDEPLHLSDSEDYALSKGWYYLEKSSFKDKLPEILKHHFICSALICTHNQVLRESYKSADIWMRKKLEACMCYFSPGDHDETCPFLHPTYFGRCVEFLLNANAALEMSKEKENGEETIKPFDLLRKLNLSYYESKRIIIDLDNDQETRNPPTILICNKDFFILFYNKEGEIVLQRHKHDGTFLAPNKSLIGVEYISPSPDHRFIVTALKEGDIEVIDSTTLQRVSSYKCPYKIKSCHVIGEQSWYIVANCSDGKIHVIEGTTGQTHNRIPITRGYEIEATSRYSHMLIGDGECIGEDYPKVNLIWRCKRFGKIKYKAEMVPSIFCRKLYLCHGGNCDLKELPTSPINEINCVCGQDFHISLNSNSVCFSQDGQLLAHHVQGSLFIHKTCDGSLYKRVLLSRGGASLYNHLLLSRANSTSLGNFITILFLTGTYVVVHDSMNMLMIINIHTNEVVNRFWFPNADEWGGKLHVVPRKQGEPFTLLTGYSEIHKCVTQYIFHNLDLV